MCMYPSIITDQINEDLETALQVAREYGYKYVELHNVFGKSIEECDVEEVKKIKCLLQKYEMKVSCIASTVFFLCPLFENDQVSLFNPHFYAIRGDVATHLSYLKNACQIAKMLGCTKVRLFPFRFPDNRKPKYGTDKQVNDIVKFVKSAVKIAEEYQITLVLENCPYSHLPKGEMSVQVVKQINSDFLKLLWDPANSYRAYQENVPSKYLETSLMEELEMIYPWIDHIHIKDYYFDSTLVKPYKHVALGNGDIGYLTIFDYLKKNGYSNAVSLEAEVEYMDTLASMKTMKEWMER